MSLNSSHLKYLKTPNSEVHEELMNTETVQAHFCGVSGDGGGGGGAELSTIFVQS